MEDFLPLSGIDHLEFYVANARQAAYYYRSAFGMKLVAYAGPETGIRDRASYVLEQDRIRFVLTTPIDPDHAMAEHIRRHGDGVRDIALIVEDADAAYRETTRRGAQGVSEPTVFSDEHREVRQSSIAPYGDTIHTGVGRKGYRRVFLPCFVASQPDTTSRPVGLKRIDHIVGNVGWGEMNT